MLINKREFLKLGAGAGAMTVMGAGSLWAAGPRLTVNTYGGVYEAAVTENFINTYKTLTGGDAQAVVDVPSAALSKIAATMPKSDYDLYVGLANDTLRAIELDLVEELSPADLPALPDLMPEAVSQWDNKAVSFSLSVCGFLYDKRKIPNPPKTWEEFATRTAAGEFGRTVSMPSASNPGVIETAIYPIADAFGGSIANPAVGFEKIAAMLPYIANFFTDLSMVVNLMSNGEISIAPYSSSRAWVFQDKNEWAGFQIPRKGAIAQSSQVMKVKNSPAESWKLMNAFIDREPAGGFAKKMNSMVPNTKVQYPESLVSRVPAQEDILYPPIREIVKNSSALIEQWNREIGG